MIRIPRRSHGRRRLAGVALASLLLLETAGAAAQGRNRYASDPMSAPRVREAVAAWRGCVTHGTQQLENPGELEAAIADAAMARCAGAETNLEDRMVETMAGARPVSDARAFTHEMLDEYRIQMRSIAIRTIQESRRGGRGGR